MTVRKFQGFLHYREIIEELKDLWRPKSFRIHRYSSVVDPGEGLRGPLFLDQTEARRVEKNFFETAAPLSQGLDDRPPHFPYLKVWIRLCSCHLYILLTTLKGLRSSRHQTISPPTKSPPRSQLATHSLLRNNRRVYSPRSNVKEFSLRVLSFG